MENNKNNILDVIKERHSVRSYIDKKIKGETLEKLQYKIEELNKESGLNMQLILDEPKAFDSFLAHYGKFNGVKNYIAIIGNKDSNLAEKAGYYGEQLVLFAQSIGLNTCWVALTFKKIKDIYKINSNEKIQLVIAIGYGENQCGEKVLDLRINNVDINKDNNILTIYIGFYHPDLGTRYGIDIVCPINYF